MIWYSTATRKMNASFAVELNLILPTFLYYIKAISNHVIDIRIYKTYFYVLLISWFQIKLSHEYNIKFWTIII